MIDICIIDGRHIDMEKFNLPNAGMTAAIIDETLGGLNYVLKREGVVPHGPSFTVHLEVGLAFPRAASFTVHVEVGLGFPRAASFTVPVEVGLGFPRAASFTVHLRGRPQLPTSSNLDAGHSNHFAVYCVLYCIALN